MSWLGWLVAAVVLPFTTFASACAIFGPRAVADTLNRWADAIDPEGGEQ